MEKEQLIKFTDQGILIFATIFILYCFVGRIVPVYVLIPESINRLVYICFVIVGCVFILIDFFLNKTMFKAKYCWILYCFIGIMIASTMVNMEYGYVDNIKTIIWTMIQVSIFYSIYTRFSKEKMLQYIYRLFCLISSIWTIAIVYSLKQFIVAESYGVEIWQGEWRLQGFRESRLFGIFNDPNYAAVASVWAIFMLLHIICKNKGKCIKIICLLSILFHGIYIVLSGSRTSIVCLLSGVFICVFLMLKNSFLDKKEVISFIIRIGIAIISVCVVTLVGLGIKKVAPYFPEQYIKYEVDKMNSRKNTDFIEKEEMEKIQNKSDSLSYAIEQGLLDRGDVSKKNISNNRFEIWINYFKSTKDQWLLGASPRKTLQHMKDKHPDIYEQNGEYETHNGFVSLYAGTGLVGCLMILVFVILVGGKICRYCFEKKKIEWQFVIIFCIVITILMYSCFFTELFFVNNLTTTLFWILLGVMMYWFDDKA